MQYTLIRSARRTLSLQIQKDGSLIVRAPHRASIDMIERLIRDKSNWISKQQVRMSERRAHDEENIGYYSLFGEKYPIGEQSPLMIKNIQKETLRSYISARLPELEVGKTFSIRRNNIQINSAKTRFGSCSSLGNISFSHMLASYPKTAIDAVIIHELAHLNERNHGPRFYHLVREWMPEYDSFIRLLKGGSLDTI